MPDTNTRPSASLFVIWLTVSIIVSLIIAAIINAVVPYRYESKAVVASNERFDGEHRISPTQAKLIERELGLENSGLNADTILRSLRLRKVPQGVEIRIHTDNRYLSREIVLEAARRFRSVKHELALTENPREVGPLSDADPQVLEDTEAIHSLLADQAAKAGFPYFPAIPSEAAGGNAAAGALLRDEDFQRRFARYKELSSILGLDGVPGEPFSEPLPLLAGPGLADRPDPDMSRILAPAALSTGIIVGLILGFKFGHKPDESQTPATPGPPAVPPLPVVPSDEW